MMAERFADHDLRAIEALFRQGEGREEGCSLTQGWMRVLVTLPLAHLAGLVVGGSLLGALVGGLMVWALS